MTSKPESLSKLFESIKNTFPASLGPEKWFLVVATSALVTCSGPFQLGQLYLYLMKQPEYASLPPRRYQDLDKDLRGFLIKQGLDAGASKAATALPDNESITKSPTQPDDAHQQEDTTFLEKLFGPEGNANLFTRSAVYYKSMAHFVVEGMTCANDWELDAVERQLVTYMGLKCPGSTWQSIGDPQRALEGLQEMDLSIKDIVQVTECGKLVALWAGPDMRYWLELKILTNGGREYPILYHRRA